MDGKDGNINKINYDKTVILASRAHFRKLKSDENLDPHRKEFVNQFDKDLKVKYTKSVDEIKSNYINLVANEIGKMMMTKKVDPVYGDQ